MPDFLETLLNHNEEDEKIAKEKFREKKKSNESYAVGYNNFEDLTAKGKAEPSNNVENDRTKKEEKTQDWKEYWVEKSIDQEVI